MASAHAPAAAPSLELPGPAEPFPAPETGPAWVTPAPPALERTLQSPHRPEPGQSPVATAPAGDPPRRLIAARDDTRALYPNTQGLRMGRKDEVLQVKQEKAVIEEVRPNDVSHVALFGNLQISTQPVPPGCEWVRLLAPLSAAD